MKWLNILVLFIAFSGLATVCGQTKVTIDIHQGNFEQLMDEIKKQTIYRFIYNQDKLPKDGINNLKVKKAEVIPLLDRLLENTGFGYTLLPNAMIAISANRKNIALTNKDATQDPKQLEEVVITALNIPKEERQLGYSVSIIKGEELTRAREANFITALEGKIAGLNISTVSGGPSSSSRILLRGAASMNAAAPLFVLNGMPIDNSQRGSANEYGGADYGDGISNINPDDIQSLTVLKGSAASALYGARAANGVILVTTKSGSRQSQPAIDYNMNFSVDKALNATDYQYIYGQGNQNKRPGDIETAILSGMLSWGERMDGKPVLQLNGKSYPYSPVKNNINRFYRLAPAWTNTVSVSTGTAKAALRLSASNMDYASVLPNSKLNRKTFNLNTSYDIVPGLNLNFNGNYIYELNKTRSYLSDGPMNANYGIQFLASSLPESVLAPGYNPQTGTETQWNNDEYKTNPYFAINRQVDDDKRNRFISSLSAKYTLSPRLSILGSFGYDISNDHRLDVLPTGTAFTINQQGSLNGLNQTQIAEMNTELLLSSKNKLSAALGLNVSAGLSLRKRNTESLTYMGAQFISPFLYLPSNLQSTNSRYFVYKLLTQSAFYTADLSWKQYLNLSSTGRYDTYSTLSAGNRGIFVPGISASFLFSDLLKIPALNYAKLRLSYAATSGEPTLPYATQTYYTSNISVHGVPLGNFSRVLANLNLRPFSMTEYEAGLNAIFLNSRLGLDITWFRRITRNEITAIEQSVTTGFTSSYLNLGQTLNRGLELQLSGVPLKLRELKWTMAFNFTHIHNRLISIDGSSRYILTGKYRPLNANTAMVTGYPITQIMAYDYKRDSQGNVMIDNTGIPIRGDFKPMGSTLPNYYGGLANTFLLKNFNLSFLLDFKFGNKVLSASENYSYVYGLNKATLEGRETGVVATGILENGLQNTINVPAYQYYPQLISNISALSVLNGSFIKFRQLSIGYTFIPRFTDLFRSVSIDLVSRNLFTLLKYSHNIDPESQFSPSLNYAGIEGSAIPLARTYGINLNFKI